MLLASRAGDYHPTQKCRWNCSGFASMFSWDWHCRKDSIGRAARALIAPCRGQASMTRGRASTSARYNRASAARSEAVSQHPSASTRRAAPPPTPRRTSTSSCSTFSACRRPGKRWAQSRTKPPRPRPGARVRDVDWPLLQQGDAHRLRAGSRLPAERPVVPSPEGGATRIAVVTRSNAASADPHCRCRANQSVYVAQARPGLATDANATAPCSEIPMSLCRSLRTTRRGSS